MKNPLAQLASKVWEALKPPKPELGYFLPDEQSDAIRSWRTNVASSVLLDPNEADQSDIGTARDLAPINEDGDSTPSSAREAAERAAAEKAKSKVAKASRKR